MYVQRPLELSAFPSILLLGTLFRLSLNVASTRIILLHGNEGTMAAGKVIMAFGGFVVGGNYLVGIIVFLILVAINFMVITKGAGRIAEVAARFTLDHARQTNEHRCGSKCGYYKRAGSPPPARIDLPGG
jgi:flagellar biosynthesis protein FlhA